MLKLKLQYFGHLMRRVDSLEKTLMLGQIRGRRRRGRQRMRWLDGIARWTWVWVNFGSWWWTGSPGVLWFMWSQRVGHDWVTELNWTDYSFNFHFYNLLLLCKKKTLLFKANFIYIHFIIFVTLFLSLILYFWESNIYSGFLIFAFLIFVINFVPLRTQSSVPIFTWEWDYWLDCSLPLWTLLFLHQVASISSLPLLFPIQLWISVCSGWWRTLRELITG